MWAASRWTVQRNLLLLHFKVLLSFLFYLCDKSWPCREKNEWNVWDCRRAELLHGNAEFQDALWTDLEKKKVQWNGWFLWQLLSQRQNCVAFLYIFNKHLRGLNPPPWSFFFFFFFKCPSWFSSFLSASLLLPPTHSGFQECIECPYLCPCKQKGEPAAEVEFLRRSAGQTVLAAMALRMEKLNKKKNEK